MEAGLGKFGDEAFMLKALDDIRQGNERGRIYAQGAARAGAHYKVARVPVIKKQSISAYDPRLIEMAGISMMITAQGADHIAGNLPVFDCKAKTAAQLVEASLGIQTACAAVDSLGLCIFGRSVTNVSAELIVTPKEIIDLLNRETIAVMKLPDLKEKLAVQGIEAASSTPEALGGIVRNEVAKWAKVIKDADIKPE